MKRTLVVVLSFLFLSLSIFSYGEAGTYESIDMSLIEKTFYDAFPPGVEVDRNAVSLVDLLIKSDKDYRIKVTYIDNIAGFNNSLGYFIYTGDSTAVDGYYSISPEEISDKTIIFDKVKGIAKGTSIEIGPFTPNQKVGFYIQNPTFTYYSVMSVNSDKSPHTGKYKDYLNSTSYMPLGFEDVILSGSDKDFNDIYAVFQVSDKDFDFPGIPTIDEVKNHDTINPSPSIPPRRIGGDSSNPSGDGIKIEGIFTFDGTLIIGGIFDENGNLINGTGIFDENGKLIAGGEIYDANGNIITGGIHDWEGNLVIGVTYNEEGKCVPDGTIDIYDKEGNIIKGGIFDINGDPITIRDGILYDINGKVYIGIVYDKDGNKIIGGLYYRNGKLIPGSVVYDSNGNPILGGIYDINGDPITIRDGILYDKDGKIITGAIYDIDGKLITGGLYDWEGKLIPGSVVYDSNGDPILGGIYDVNGDPITIRDGILYDKDGKIITGAIYDIDGKLITGGLYDWEGKLIPGSVVYDSNGNPILGGIYDVNGDPITIRDGILYDKDGKIVTGGVYDSEGNLIKDGIFYSDGKPIDGSSDGDNTTGGTDEVVYDEDGNIIPGGIMYDLAVSLSTDKTKYAKGQIITYTIDFKNKYNVEVGEVVIKAQIPAYTIAENTAGGEVKGNIIEWKYSKLEPNFSGKIVYQVVVEELDQPQIFSINTVSIISTKDTLVNKKDDTSSIKLLLFSNDEKSDYHALYVLGYPDKTFGPYRSVTRAEVATIFARISGIESTGGNENTFSDVLSNHWASKFIKIATKDLGLFTGYEDKTFRPDRPITRAELAVVAINYLKTGNPVPFSVTFQDSKTHWAKNFIEEAYRNKLVVGYEDGSFRPNTNISRAEFVTIINKMLYRGPLITTSSTFPDVANDYWAFGQIEEASRNHFYKRDEKGNEILVDK